ncbi:MAG: EsaB/YukD family protein [Dermatophilaceae bacterium]
MSTTSRDDVRGRAQDDAGAEQRRVRSFSKVSIVGPSSQGAMAVPDDMPVPALAKEAATFLGEPGGRRWVIEHPVHGVLGWRDTLAGLHVRDGSVLYLRPDQEAATRELVDDVARVVAETATTRGSWAPDIARLAGALALAVWLLVNAGVGAVESDPLRAGAALVVAVVAAAALRAVQPDAVGQVAVAAAVAASGPAVWAVVTASSTGGPLAAAELGGALAAAALASAVAAAVAALIRPDTRRWSLALASSAATVAVAAAGWDCPLNGVSGSTRRRRSARKAGH